MIRFLTSDQGFHWLFFFFFSLAFSICNLKAHRVKNYKNVEGNNDLDKNYNRESEIFKFFNKPQSKRERKQITPLPTTKTDFDNTQSKWKSKDKIGRLDFKSAAFLVGNKAISDRRISESDSVETDFKISLKINKLNSTKNGTKFNTPLPPDQQNRRFINHDLNSTLLERLSDSYSQPNKTLKQKLLDNEGKKEDENFFSLKLSNICKKLADAQSTKQKEIFQNKSIWALNPLIGLSDNYFKIVSQCERISNPRLFLHVSKNALFLGENSAWENTSSHGYNELSSKTIYNGKHLSSTFCMYSNFYRIF